MKFGITFVSVLIIIAFFMMMKKVNKAEDLKLKYSIDKTLLDWGYFTNEYRIDSLGMVHFKDGVDSVDIIISGSYTISENNWK